MSAVVMSVVVVLLLVAAPVAAQDAAEPLKTPAAIAETAPEVFRARIDTNEGPFVIEVHRAWAPLAADRFYTLVRHGFYDGNRFHRVRPGFVAQWGLHGDPSVQRAWQFAPLRDDPAAGQSNVRGTVTFTTENRPQSRFTQVFVNLVDNAFLDNDGFVPFGRVVSGLEVVEKMYSYGREKEPDQRRILRSGNEYLTAEFPELDYIEKATIVEP